MEIILTIVCLIITILSICAIIIISGKRKVDILKVRLEEAQKNIDYFLEKKEETLEKVIPLIIASNKRKYGKKTILEDLIKNKNIKRDFIKKDIDLKENLKEFYTLLEEDEKLQQNKEIYDVYFDSVEIENDLNATKKYYNKIADKWENEFKKFPANSLKSSFGYKKIEQFNTKKEEWLEILKEEKPTEEKEKVKEKRKSRKDKKK